MAAPEGDLDLALEYYEQALSESEYSAIFLIQAPFWNGKIFPGLSLPPKISEDAARCGG